MRREILGVLAAAFSMAWTASAAAPAPLSNGDRLPELRGEFLTGREAVLPQAAKGRIALLMLGFTYDSRYSVEPWAEKFRHAFDGDSRVTFFEIPMIGGMAKLGKWFIDSGMRRNTPKADQENVITVYTGTDAWKQRVGFSDPKVAYLILIDQRGNVSWRHTGNVDDAALAAVSSEVNKLLANTK